MFDKVIIASGPTLEPIDPIRFLSNRSSGRTGYHLAQAALERGVRKIIFITGPTAYIPEGVDVRRIESALEMRREILREFHDSHVLIMAAAVSDFRSAKYYPEKIKKERERLTLKLVKNPDILSECGTAKRDGQIVVGFAAETDDIFANAERKLFAKNLDLLVLNEISEQNPAFNCDDNQVYLLTRAGIEKLEKMAKSHVAGRIWDAIQRLSQ